MALKTKVGPGGLSPGQLLFLQGVRWRGADDVINNSIGYAEEMLFDGLVDCYESAWHRGPCSEDLWREHGAPFLREFINAKPGKRPAPWWDYDRAGYRLRDRVGGIGTPLYHGDDPEVFAVKMGVQARWKLHGFRGLQPPQPWDQPKPPEPAGPLLDPKNPPLFESEAAYLMRHGLLVKGERAKLTEGDFEPESVLDIVRFDADEL
jgi:hypothetical protein